MPFKIIKKHKCYDGETAFCEHESQTTKSKMKFSYHLPGPKEEVKGALIWLSGLTCTEENFITKSNIQNALKGTSLMVICPDTSPRGLGLAGEEDTYEFGTGASFYLNATAEPYKNHYQMYDYITQDMVSILKDDFNQKNIGIFGHSMGGHGALVIGLRESSLFKSVSAFAPIVSPINSPWGEKAFSGYLGDDKKTWQAYDTCALLSAGKQHPNSILIDQGSADEFLKERLKTPLFEEAAQVSGQKYMVNYREGYDHSYYFISTFIKEHINHHAKYLY